MNKIYAAYGSNIHPVVISSWAPEAKEVGVGLIKNYGLTFRGGLATIEPQEGEEVPIKLYEITQEDEIGLDEYEGYAIKLYDKINLPIEIKEYNENYIMRLVEPAEAMVYIMDSKYPKSMPSKDYLNSIIYGYKNTEEHYKKEIFTIEKIWKALTLK